MNELITKAYDPEYFRKTGKELVDLLADYLDAALTGKEMQVLPWTDPEVQLKQQRENLKAQKSYVQLISEVIRESIHIHHPHYVGHQVSAPLPLTALSELVGTLLNNGSAVYEMGPVSVAMEKVVMQEMAAILGFPTQSEGFFTSGGTLGNLTAILAARQAMAPFDVWKEGMDRSKKLAFMVPADAHYSVVRALRIAGFGDEGILDIPVDNDFRTNHRELERIYTEATDKGLQVIGLSANACSTAAGVYDRLDRMADFCRKYDLWFHIDGAHGVPAIFSKVHAQKLQGIAEADSVVIDFHKMMNTPALLTLVLFRDAGTSFSTFSQNASYLFEKAGATEWYNYSKRTMECTKRMMGLTVFTLWKFYGPAFLSAFVEQTCALAIRFAEHIKETKNFELAITPESNIVCFRFAHPQMTHEKQNEINRIIRREITREGSFYLVQADLGGYTWLRLTLMNPFTSIDDLTQLLQIAETKGIWLSQTENEKP